MFQFLIGTVKTSDRVTLQIDGTKFQFLIGTVKTKEGIRYLGWIWEVSIPHRYCKNMDYQKVV